MPVISRNVSSSLCVVCFGAFDVFFFGQTQYSYLVKCELYYASALRYVDLTLDVR